VLLLAVVALGIPLALSLRDRVDAEVRDQARSEANIVAATAAAMINTGERHALDQVTRTAARSVRGRVLVLGPTGRVIADSAPGAETVGVSYASRPEVAAALHGADYQETRESQTLGTQILATAVPMTSGGRTVGAVRVTQSVDAVTTAVRHAILGLAILGAVVLGLALIAGALIAQQIARPIRRLDQVANRVAAGELDAQAAVEGSTEQRSLAGAFNNMTERMRRLLRSQQDFVADASHQLRTPLTGLRLQLEELREETEDRDPRSARLDAGIAEVDRLSEMVDELLILSRAGEHERPGESVDLARVADHVVKRWRKAADDAGVRLTRRAEGEGAQVWCAPADLDRALDALVENAIRYSPAGGAVDVVSAPDRVEVLDEGPGLDAAEQEAIFERFYRGRAGRNGPAGTGLGLPIAKELVEQWGGSVALTNRSGQGARAVVTFQRNRLAAGDGYR
jgi:two-component system, OmpR family, sensor kinase